MSDELVSELQDMVGDSLRAAATYDRESYDQVYAREGIDADQAAIERIHENLVLEGIGVEYLENVFGAGDLECTMHRFERAMIFHFVGADYTGLFVSVDPEADVPISAFADRCEAFVT